jgi:hypothetical protein
MNSYAFQLKPGERLVFEARVEGPDQDRTPHTVLRFPIIVAAKADPSIEETESYRNGLSILYWIRRLCRWARSAVSAA